MYPNSGLLRKNRNVVLDRAGRKCEDCGGEKNLDVHHLDLSKDNHEISNLKVVCKRCHINRYHEKKYPKHEIAVTEQTFDLECRKCNHQWHNRLIRKPLCCPACKSYNWDNDMKESTNEKP